jgi:hypothetical protein
MVGFDVSEGGAAVLEAGGSHEPTQVDLAAGADRRARPEGADGAPGGERGINQAQHDFSRGQPLAITTRAFAAKLDRCASRLEAESARLKVPHRRAGFRAETERCRPAASRGACANAAVRNAALLQGIRALKAEHPFPLTVMRVRRGAPGPTAHAGAGGRQR